MPDWKQIVRKNLRVLKACSPEFTEKIAGEMAAHLEDSYEEHLRAGLTEEAALQRTLDEIKLCRGNWLALRLLREDQMNGFTRRVGLPGLLTFAVAMAIAWALDMAHIQPKIIFLHDGMFLSLPIVWMCLLPVCGALGAFLSCRAGGSRVDRMIAASSPAIIFAAVLLLMPAVGFVISLFVPNYDEWHWRLVAWFLALWGTGYSILPAIPLLMGAAAAEQAKRIGQRAA